MCAGQIFGINVSSNTVFSLQFVAITSSGFHNTVASVLHNQIVGYFPLLSHLLC